MSKVSECMSCTLYSTNPGVLADVAMDEMYKYKRAWKISSLLENFGKTALTVLSGYGVGADTAARILRDMTDDENLCKQIMTAEKQYALTRGFWDS